MDDKRIDKAAAFDTLFTSNRIQILKILAYYMDPRLLKGLAVYIKMSELQYTLTLFRRHPETSLCIAPSSANEETATELCNDLMPLCDETQKSALRQITQMMDNIHNFQEMMEMVQTMQELFPEGFSDLSGMDPSMFGTNATLILNAKHPLVQYILKNGENNNTSLFCEQLYDLAMISHKPLSPDEMTKFVSRSNQIMMLLAK
mgnify:CR=1 FL=1